MILLKVDCLCMGSELKSSFDLEAYEYLRGAGLLTHMVYLKMSWAPAQCDMRSLRCIGNL
jgi:hypothetical protein